MRESAFVRKTNQFSNTFHSGLVKKILAFDAVKSTNATAKELAMNGAEQGTLVIAHTQSQGRGRFQRPWESPQGGAYLSLILRPTMPVQKTSLLSLVTSLAINRTIASLGLHATIKWPNDVRVNGKKVAGILLESEMDVQKISYVVVGIGVNLNFDIKDLSEEIRGKSTSLLKETDKAIDYYEFITALLVEFEKYYTLLCEADGKQIIDEWKKQSDTLGKKIRIETSSEIIHGTAYDINEAGFLIVRASNGIMKKITSGDCLYFNEL